jgi:hypothetical protein
VNATTGAWVCDATVLEMLPDGGTMTLPVFNGSGVTRPSGDAGGDSGASVACLGASFAPNLGPGESATVTISAPGFKSTTVTVTYEAAQPSSGVCCPGLSLGRVALVPQ